MNTRTMLVDDHPVTLAGLRILLKKRDGIKIVAEAADGREAVDFAFKHKPDLILMDITMPECDGIMATQAILSKLKDVKIIGFSGYSDESMIRKLFRAGACGYISKCCVCSDLLAGVNAVLAGKRYLSPDLMNSFMSGVDNGDLAKQNDCLASLTCRQRQVLDLILDGLSTKDIAARLGIASKTVSKHREAMLAKAKVKNVFELVKYAARSGVRLS